MEIERGHVREAICSPKRQDVQKNQGKYLLSNIITSLPSGLLQVSSKFKHEQSMLALPIDSGSKRSKYFAYSDAVAYNAWEVFERENPKEVR